MRRFELTKTAILIGVVALALVSAGASAAQRDRGRRLPRAPEPGRFFEEHAERLDLDEKTRDAIHSIVEQSKPKADELRGKLRESHRALRTLLSEEEPDEKAVMKQSDRIGKLETQNHKHRLTTMLKIRKLLSLEQRAELEAVRREARRRSGADRPIEECEADVEEFCLEAEGPWAIRRCMQLNLGQLSEQCVTGLQALQARRQRRQQGPGQAQGPGPQPAPEVESAP